jgi:hypothetical protein
VINIVRDVALCLHILLNFKCLLSQSLQLHSRQAEQPLQVSTSGPSSASNSQQEHQQQQQQQQRFIDQHEEQQDAVLEHQEE